MIETWSQGQAADNMPEEILTDLSNQVHRHPWWQARATLALALLQETQVHPGSKVLDAGCGWGVTLEALEQQQYRVTGLDISRRALERLDHPDRSLIEADLLQAVPHSLAQFDAVLALDVIEHVDDDTAALRTLAALTKRGGVAIVSVPALPELYSEFDRIQGHRRRYVPATLQSAFRETDLIVERMLWWGEWMVPLVKAQRTRLWRKGAARPVTTYRRYLSLPPWPMPLAMTLAFRLSQSRTLRGAERTGTSLFAVARRAHAY